MAETWQGLGMVGHWAGHCSGECPRGTFQHSPALCTAESGWERLLGLWVPSVPGQCQGCARTVPGQCQDSTRAVSAPSQAGEVKMFMAN